MSRRPACRQAGLALALLLLASAAQADPTPQPTPRRRYTLGDTEKKPRARLIECIENVLPFTLALILGIRSDRVRVEGQAGPVRVAAGQEK